MAKTRDEAQDVKMTGETLAKFKEKIATMHHDLFDLLNGVDIIFDELVELENMADKELHTHLAEDAERMQGAPWLEDEEDKRNNN